MYKCVTAIVGLLLATGSPSALAAACSQQSARAFGSDIDDNEATTQLIVQGYCSSARCELQVEYSVTYVQTISMNGFPVSTAGAQKAVANLEVENGPFNERFDDETTIVPCTGRNIECSAMGAEVKRVNCVQSG